MDRRALSGVCARDDENWNTEAEVRWENREWKVRTATAAARTRTTQHPTLYRHRMQHSSVIIISCSSSRLTTPRLAKCTKELSFLIEYIEKMRKLKTQAQKRVIINDKWCLHNVYTLLIIVLCLHSLSLSLSFHFFFYKIIWFDVWRCIAAYFKTDHNETHNYSQRYLISLSFPPILS